VTFETKPLWDTMNLDGQTTCAHCHFSGLVLLDTESQTAAPCPMCPAGERFDVSSYGGLYWRHIRDLADTTWQNKITIRHARRCRFTRDEWQYPCREPSTGQYCDHHNVEHNRLPLAASKHFNVPMNTIT